MNILRSCQNRNTAVKYTSKLRFGLRRILHQNNKPRNNHRSILRTVGREPSPQQAKFPRLCRPADSLLPGKAAFPQAVYPMVARQPDRTVVFPSALSPQLGERAFPSPTYSGLRARWQISISIFRLTREMRRRRQRRPLIQTVEVMVPITVVSPVTTPVMTHLDMVPLLATTTNSARVDLELDGEKASRLRFTAIHANRPLDPSLQIRTAHRIPQME